MNDSLRITILVFVTIIVLSVVTLPVRETFLIKEMIKTTNSAITGAVKAGCTANEKLIQATIQSGCKLNDKLIKSNKKMGLQW